MIRGLLSLALFQVLGPTVGNPLLAPAHETALGGDDDFTAVAAPGPEGLPEKPLVRARIGRIGGLDIGGVEKPNSRVERSVQNRERVLSLEPHRPEAQSERSRAYPHSPSQARVGYGSRDA